jgi:curli biogenesis system outer membrane secretion channel CsgG
MRALALLALPLLFAGCSTSDSRIVVREKFHAINRVAVVRFGDAPAAEAGRSGSVVSAAIVNELLKVPRLTVVERERLQAVLQELKLSLSDLVDGKEVAKLGKLLGVDAIIMGTVSQYRTSTIPIFLVLFTYYQDVYHVAASLRVVNVESGEILLSGESSASSSDGYQDAANKVASEVISKLRLAD